MAAFWPARHKRRNKPGHGDKKLDSDVSGSNKSDSNCTHTRHTADKYKILQAQNTKYYKRKIQNITSAKYKILQGQNKSITSAKKILQAQNKKKTSAKYKILQAQNTKYYKHKYKILE